MSLIHSLFLPSLTGRDWISPMDYSSRLRHQNFGLGMMLADMLDPVDTLHHCYIRPRRSSRNQASSQGSSEVTNDKDKFQVVLDVSHFKPEELNVKTVDNCVVIQGKHEEREDEHGYIQREFVRRYALPKDVEPKNVVTSLSPDGFLIVEAPKKMLESPPPNERNVPIEMRSAPMIKTSKSGDAPAQTQSMDE